MSQHSVAETRNNFSALLERAERGEEILITRHGKPVATLNGVSIKPMPKRITQADIEWLRKRRVGRKVPKEDAGTLVSRMRDEDSVRLIRRMRDEDWP
jgi:prevent-host-death family protein